MATIERTDIDALNATLTVTVAQEDYKGELNKELKILYPELLDFSIGKVTKVAGNNYNPDLPVIQTNWATSKSKKENSQKVTRFVQERMGLDTLLSY